VVGRSEAGTFGARSSDPKLSLSEPLADLIDQDHTSQTRYEAIAKAAGAVAARATPSVTTTGDRLATAAGWLPSGGPLLPLLSRPRP
jgi:hypothetical protein